MDILNGITLTAVEVPARPDHQMGDNPMYHFNCTLMYEGRAFNFFFSLGIAHHTGRLRKAFGPLPRWKMLTIPQGDKRFIPSAWGVRMSVEDLLNRQKHIAAKSPWEKDKFADLLYEPKQPDLNGTLACLLSDAQAGEMSFAEFCTTFGYDEDSRKAERTWQACVQTERGLTTLFGRMKLQQLMDRQNEIESGESEEPQS